jgi:dolichol-phosphate mannosyltransferase
MIGTSISLSLAAPAYNEAGGIAVIVENWLVYLRAHPRLTSFEIVICDDGSADDTAAILDRLAELNSELRVIHFTINQGAAAALTAAIQSTRNDWVLLIDSDGQFPIENFDKMLQAIDSTNLRAAIGVRTKQDTLFARFGSWSSGYLCNVFHGTRYRDFNSAFKLVNGGLLRLLCLEAKGLNYSTEITSKLLEVNEQLAEVDIAHKPRLSGKSSLKMIRGASHRFIFVAYIGLRQLMLRLGIMQRRTI